MLRRNLSAYYAGDKSTVQHCLVVSGTEAVS